MAQRRHYAAVGLLALTIGCGPKRTSAPVSTPEAVPEAAGLGLAKSTAIRVCGPSGQREYLGRLRCPSGEAVRFRRSGSVGQRNPGEMDLSLAMDMDSKLPEGTIDAHIVDLYEVKCGETITEVFLDMYHCADPDPLGPIGPLRPPG